MAYYLNEDWLQEVHLSSLLIWYIVAMLTSKLFYLKVVSSIELPPVSSSVARLTLPVVEMQIRKLLQQSHKFQRRGKKKYLTGIA